jgi:hypothetical protein
MPGKATAAKPAAPTSHERRFKVEGMRSLQELIDGFCYGHSQQPHRIINYLVTYLKPQKLAFTLIDRCFKGPAIPLGLAKTKTLKVP